MMDLTNNDILEEIWKHLSFNSMIKFSKVSKYNNYKFYTISQYDKINKIYIDTYNINLFCYQIIKYECKKYNYKIKQKIRSIIVKFILNKNLNNYIKSNNFIILYNFIRLIIHSLKLNYRILIHILSSINYKNILFQYDKNFAEIIRLNTTFIISYLIDRISNYDQKKIKLVKICCFIHTLILSSANIDKHKEFINISKIKKQEIIENLDVINLNNEYPKYFVKKILKLVNNINI